MNSDKKRMIMYVVIVIICIASIVIGVVTEVATTGTQKKNIMTEEQRANKVDDGTPQIDIPDVEELNALNKEFNSLFKNTLSGDKYDDSNIAKLDATKDVVYTFARIKQIQDEKYNIDINIPIFNIGTGVAGQYNQDISTNFVEVVNNITADNSTSKDYVVYNLNYVAFINDNILSVVIKSTLKEGDKPQKTVVKTYNYDLDTGKAYTIKDAIKSRGVEESKVQEKIDSTIQGAIAEEKDISTTGLNAFKRNANDDMYKINNSKEFFLGSKGYLYIVYCYGNDDINTSTVDVVKI